MCKEATLRDWMTTAGQGKYSLVDPIKSNVSLCGAGCHLHGDDAEGAGGDVCVVGRVGRHHSGPEDGHDAEHSNFHFLTLRFE